MPAHPFYSNWTAGTVSEKLASRTDFAKYANAARIIRNGIVLPQGGVASRSGTVFLGAAKAGGGRVRMVPFSFSADVSYMVEFGVGYARFWRDREHVLSGSDPFEVTTPYTEDNLRELRFEQSADVMYIGHPSHPPAKISRVTATTFQYDVINFLPYPSFEQRLTLAADLTLGSASVGPTTATTSASVFLAGDVGRQIWVGVGRAVISAVNSGTSVDIRVLDAFTGTSHASGTWQLDGSPNFSSITVGTWRPRWFVTTLTASIGTFRAADQGKYLYLLDGVVEIVGVGSSTEAAGQILSVMDEEAGAVADVGTWTMESPVWSSSLGYPGVPCLFQSRLWWAGSDNFRDYLWGSRVSDYENHARGALDSHAIVQQMGAGGVNLVRWVKPNSQRGLALGTIGSEITVEGGTDEPIKPNNVLITERTKYGSDNTPDAIRADNQNVFLQRGGLRVRELAYKFSDDAFASPDISILAEHLFTEPIVELTAAATPESVLLAVRDDGVINFCTYERPQNVVAWSYADTDGDDDFESAGVIASPDMGGDEVWLATRRQFEGGGYWGSDYWASNYWDDEVWTSQAVGRYIEVFDTQMNTDAGLVWSGAAASTFTGLDHLEGRTVRVVCANGDEYDLVVSGGAVTLPVVDLVQQTTTSVEVGLPFEMTLGTVRPDLALPTGTMQGRQQRWSGVTVRVYSSRGSILLNDEALSYPDGTDTSEAFSGDMKKITTLGWGRDGYLTIRRTQAKPCTITSITGGLTVGDD